MKDDSRKIEVGDTYISLTNNEKYILDAIERGASKVIVESGLYSVDTLVVKNTREYLINYLDDKYKDKFKNIKIVGITGTNGKTTSCYLLWQILNKLNIKTSYIGTIGFYMDKKIKDLNNTTPDILDIYEMINKSIDEGYKYIVMEVSSQALDMNRLGKLRFNYAVFTNLTKEHLDYHKTMNNYALAKQILFKQSDISLINIDDEYSNYFILDNCYTFGINKSDYRITDITINDNTSFKLNNEEYKTNIIGKYNIYNLIPTLIILEIDKINYNKEILTKLEYPPGRLELIKKDDNKIIIDYAHTPDAVEKVIKTVKELNPNNIITIIGCGGNRDKTKRPIMGDITTKLSNYVIFTNDNPREEDPDSIIKDIIQNLDTTNYEIIPNREKAIIKGIQKLTKNDILLLLGKGHENYQIIGKNKYPFSDLEIVKNNI